MNPTHLVLMILALATTASHAQPDLLWDNGEWDGAKGVRADRNTTIPDSWLVDDFVLTDTVMLRELEWLALKPTDFEPIATDFILLTATLDLVVELFDHEFTSEFEGTGWGLDIHRITIPNLSIELAPGRYYIGARFVGDGTGRAFTALQYPIHGETESYFRSEYFGEPDWIPISNLGAGPFDAVFKVYGDIIPAPPTLFALTLPGLFALRRRR